MPLSAGTKLGPYEILAPIGKGGMGEVYHALDSRLNRDVAIKVSNAQFTERFTREARAIAALNHTNICMSAAPSRVRKLLRRCLEKDRKNRLQAIGDARRLLQETTS